MRVGGKAKQFSAGMARDIKLVPYEYPQAIEMRRLCDISPMG